MRSLPLGILPFLSPALLALGGGVILIALLRYWGANPGYADRFLVLLGSAWAAWQLRSAFLQTPPNPRPILGHLVLLLGAALFPLGVFLIVQIGPRTLLLWWLTLSWLAMLTGWLVATQGLPRWRVMLFPLLFTLFALPIPLRILNPLQDRLQAITTSASYSAFQLFGLQVEREQYVLTLPSGKLGVEEACSGVRSLTALTALAAYLAYWYGFGPRRGLSLLLAAIPIVAMVNIVRVVLSGLIQEALGPQYIVGAWHEGLGFLMVFVGLGLILVVATQLDRLSVAATPTPQAELLPVGPASWVATLLLGLATLASLTSGYLGSSQIQQHSAKAPLPAISLTLGSWQGEDQPIPDVVQELLAPDVVIHRRYRNSLGQAAFVWALSWSSGSAIQGYHHPDVCWGNKGFTPSEKWQQQIQGIGTPFPTVAREFRQQASRQTILYWTQEGSYIWTEADEAAAVVDMLTVQGSGHRWVTDLLGLRSIEVGPRLTVVIVLPGAGPAVRRDAIDLAERFSTELHQIVPWSQPTTATRPTGHETP